MTITSIKLCSFKNSLDPSQGPDLKSKPPPRRRKIKNSGASIRPAGRRSRPETPLLKWKFDVSSRKNDEVENPSEVSRKTGRKVKAALSTRNLAVALWRMQLPEGPTIGGDRVGFQSRENNLSVHFHGHHSCNAYDPVHSPHSFCSPKNGLLNMVETSTSEGATKWDPINRNRSNNVKQIEAELEHARARIEELENDKKSSKKKMEHFLKMLSEERATWRNKEHEKIRVIIEDMKSQLNHERKNRRRFEIVNAKLVNELADAKLSGKRYMQEYQKERKGRELIEEVCDELAKEIDQDKAEIKELTSLREEIEEERKMLQMAEVWREERVQMKLIDAKVVLEEKYAQINYLINEIESFLNSRGGTHVEEVADVLQKAAKELSYESGACGTRLEACEDGSEWETVSHVEEDYSSLSRSGSEGGVSHHDVAAEYWSSPEVARGTIAQKMSLKAKLLEARKENQKVQLRQVLKQKM